MFVSFLEGFISGFFLFVLGMLFLVGGLIAFPQLERMSNIVQLQFMSGIKSYVYWLTTFVFDLIYLTIAFCEMMFYFQLYAAFLSKTHLFSGLTEYSKYIINFPIEK